MSILFGKRTHQNNQLQKNDRDYLESRVKYIAVTLFPRLVILLISYALIWVLKIDFRGIVMDLYLVIQNADKISLNHILNVTLISVLIFLYIED